MVTVDEGDQFAGGIGIPQPDGTLAYSHTNCSWTTTPACPSNQIGEVNLNIRPKLPAGTPSFSIHNDSAPTFYVNGQPDRTDPALRKMERDVFALNAIDPYVSSSPGPVFVRMADAVEQRTLHMVNGDPRRTPSFTAFGDPNYFITAAASGPSCGSNPCIDYHSAWSNGGIQLVIPRSRPSRPRRSGTDRPGCCSGRGKLLRRVTAEGSSPRRAGSGQRRRSTCCSRPRRAS